MSDQTVVDPFTSLALSTSLRGGVVLLLLLLGAALLRERQRAMVARLGAWFAFGAAAYTVCSTPGFHAWAGAWAAPLAALAVGGNLVFWLFARAVFDDSFRLHYLHVCLWAAIAAVGIVGALGLAPPAAEAVIGLAVAVQALAFAGLAVAQTIGSWRADLIEPRRRLRVFIVAASALHIALTAAAGLGSRLEAMPQIRLADAASLAFIALIVAWAALREGAGALLFSPPTRETETASVGAAKLEAADISLLRRLERMMNEERAYRRDDLTVGRLAQALDVPEYRLRRVINGGLGHRNFAAYLNGRRLVEVRSALADPAQAEVPILTIALDAGFGSLGPFNRAFKAATGLTPSAFRRIALGGSEEAAPAALSPAT
jgi:AraC-like DNA-binding protein